MTRLYCLLVLLITINIATSEIKNIGWWRNAVIYQIYPRSFKDSNNDGIGDLRGIISKLEYFNETGINAVWLSPIYASPMVDFGYDISDFREIHPDYGTQVDFDDLVKRAKELGIKVILDLVPNHTSDKHKWFQASLAGEKPFTDYYIWRNCPDRKPPNNWISAFGGSAWTFVNSSQTQCYFHQFHAQQPDLNFRNKEVQKEMVEIMKFWLDRGVDGFRVDAIPHLFEIEDFRDEPRTNISGVTDTEYRYLQHIYTSDQPETYDLVKQWKQNLDHYANSTNTDEKVLMTEAYTNLKNTTKYYDLGVQVPFNFFFITGADNTSSPDQFKNIIDAWLNETASRKGAVSNWVMGNHDKPRLETRYPGRGDQMTMLAMILPGVAVTYYGEEIAMVDKSDISYNDTQDPAGCNAGPDKYKEHSRDPARTPMQWNNSTNAGFNEDQKPWIPVHQNYMHVNLAAQKAANISHYKIYKKLIHLKKTRAAISSGTVQTFVSSDKKSLVIVRAAGNEGIVLVINFSNTENITINVVSHVPSLGPAATVEVVTLGSPIKEGSSVDLKNLKIAAKQSLILSAKITESKGKGKGGSGTIALSSILCVFALLLATSELFH